MDLHSDNRAAHIAPGSRPSVPYGQACTNCSKAKCKCIGRGHGAPCERCSRLHKECRPSVSVRKRTARRSTAGRTAQLEEKLDDLVSILRAQTAGNPAASSAYSQVSVNTALDMSEYMRNNLISPDETSKTHEIPTATSYPTPSSVASHNDVGLEPAQAEETLQLFREQHLKFFPFVYIPPETAAVQLQQRRPFLWLNIRTICCKSASQQQVLGLRCREILAQKTLVDLDRDIDLLLGLLTYIGWAMHHFSGKPYLVSLSNLAISLVTDLRLDKPVQDTPSKEMSCFKTPYNFRPFTATHPRTNEERRAVLACFIFCSTVSSFLRSQSLRWNPQIEEMLEKLGAEPECTGDELLVAMTKVYKIHEEIAQATWRSPENYGNPMSSRPPPVLYVKALRANLEEIKRDLPPSLVGNKVIASFFYTAELTIADMPLWHTNSSLTCMQSPPKPSPSNNGDLTKLDAYYATMQACKACLDNFLSFEPAEFIGLSFPLVLHFGRSTQVLYRLLLADDPDWDRAIVRDTVDLLDIMERGAASYEQVAELYGIESDGPGEGEECLDFYTKCANALRATIPIWGATLDQLGVGRSGAGARGAAGVGTTGGAGAAAAAGVGQAGASMAPIMMDQSGFGLAEYMDFENDAWMTDILRTWDG
ncbi:hypothetical protein F5B20DRAFT_539175 [Whalleya microplaca]|nr:hypothetical protein F5B20DRAFT_539175 [Whalleya microplaca]